MGRSLALVYDVVFFVAKYWSILNMKENLLHNFCMDWKDNDDKWRSVSSSWTNIAAFLTFRGTALYHIICKYSYPHALYVSHTIHNDCLT